jgi:hypothetical protein
MTTTGTHIRHFLTGLILVCGCTPTAPPAGNDNATTNDNQSSNANDNVSGNINANDNEEEGFAESFVALLDGAQENPPVSTTANGAGMFRLNASRTRLTFLINAAGLSGPLTGAHFHNAPRGENGPIVFNFTEIVEQVDDFVVINGVWDLTATESTIPAETALQELLADRIYVNLHTENNPVGEIRGQIIYPDDEE